MPCRARKVFSRSRFCATQTRPPAGPHRASGGPATASAGAETFSNSTVTASARSAERPQRRQVVVAADDRPVGHLRGRRVLGLAEHPGAIAHPLRRLDEHPAELAAADHAQRRRGKQRSTRPSTSDPIGDATLIPATPPRRRSAPGGTAPGPRGSPDPSGPGSPRPGSRRWPRPKPPMASVPTGTPLRHLHDRQQRVDPAQHLALDRHAQHRQDRDRRQHPRQVRRPAGAGDQHLQAPPLGLAAVAKQPLRRPVRRDHLAPRTGCPARSGPRSACRIVSQSDLLPITTPTIGAREISFAMSPSRGKGSPDGAGSYGSIRRPGIDYSPLRFFFAQRSAKASSRFTSSTKPGSKGDSSLSLRDDDAPRPSRRRRS